MKQYASWCHVTKGRRKLRQETIKLKLDRAIRLKGESGQNLPKAQLNSCLL